MQRDVIKLIYTMPPLRTNKYINPTPTPLGSVRFVIPYNKLLVTTNLVSFLPTRPPRKVKIQLSGCMRYNHFHCQVYDEASSIESICMRWRTAGTLGKNATRAARAN